MKFDVHFLHVSSDRETTRDATYNSRIFCAFWKSKSEYLQSTTPPPPVKKRSYCCSWFQTSPSYHNVRSCLATNWIREIVFAHGRVFLKRTIDHRAIFASKIAVKSEVVRFDYSIISTLQILARPSHSLSTVARHIQSAGENKPYTLYRLGRNREISQMA